ncbi:putative carboxylesterase 11 [Cocos nucifera]|nr:putative carboxylesterase 11 [Cocos nucifera]
MPSVGVKLYSVFFKLLLRHRLQSRIQNPSLDPFGVTSRPEESTAPANPSFADDKFHGGAFVAGSNASAANDFFCRRIARLCEAIVIAVGYRLAPESRYPAAFEDGLKVLNWLGKQANLAECSKSMGSVKSGGGVKMPLHQGISSSEPNLVKIESDNSSIG